MVTNPTFWFLVSFVLFFVFFGKAVWRMIADGVDTRSRKIAADIEEAAKLKEQAQALLDEIRAKQKESGAHAEAILEHARLEAERLRTEAAKELEEYMRHREQLVQQRINFAEQEAVKDIQDSAVDLATRVAEKLIMKASTEDISAKLTLKAIRDLSQS
ncbi:MAG: F0F1 ATP synthase subunit B [Alphaproteobacteria bacterium]|nr:F0F1 ATP synthase subunit B [Alphaproteobacteria bacterium]